jgi:hypothetical protein
MERMSGGWMEKRRIHKLLERGKRPHMLADPNMTMGDVCLSVENVLICSPSSYGGCSH